MANIGSIIGGTFRIFRERPVSVAIWTAVHIAFGIVTMLIGRQQMSAMMANPAAMEPGSGSPFALFGWWIIPTWLAMAVFFAVMVCAVFRTVLRPSENSFASMRLGMDELRMIGLALLLGVALFILGLLIMLLFVVVLAGAVAVTGGGATGILIGVVAYVGCFIGWIYLWVRLSLMFPLTFLRRRFAVDEAWSLTSGNFWTLFLAYLVIWVITTAIALIIAWPSMAPIAQMVMHGTKDPTVLQQLQQEQMERQLNMPFAQMLVMGVLNAVLSVISLVLGAGVAAVASREILLDKGELLEDDAEQTAAIFE